MKRMGKEKQGLKGRRVQAGLEELRDISPTSSAPLPLLILPWPLSRCCWS